jgi:thiol:disulfide interchange protein DsbD
MTRRAIFTAAIALVCSSASAAPVGAKVTLVLEASEQVAARGVVLGIEAIATIADGWHVHSNTPPEPYLIPTELTLSLPAGFADADVHYPPAEERSFAFAPGLKLSVYEGKLGIAAGVEVPADYAEPSLPIAALLRYQACNDTTCLPPATVSATLEIAISKEAPVAPGAPDAATGAQSGDGEVFARWLADRGILFTLLAVALLGLGLNLTPCVYPLISVTIAYFGRQTSSRAVVAWLAALYVFGIALSFSAVGLAAALSGGVFGAALQNPFVIVGIATVMVVLALGSFGVYQFQPPAFLLRWAGKAGGGGSAGALFMGLTMGIVAAPCVGPIVLGLLVFVGSRQDPWLGFLLFFVLALGMGAPYLLLAMAAGSIQRLPRSGEWLLWTERLFGCILLAMAAYFSSTLFPEPIKSTLLPAVIILSGLYLGFVERAGARLRWFPHFKRAAGVLLLVLGIWIGRPVAQSEAIAWEGVDHFLSARHDDRPVLIDFVAEWCIPCREMDRTTYIDAEVLTEAERFRMVKADLTEENDETAKIVEEFAVRGVPTLILRSKAGEETHRMVGYVGPGELLDAMREVD